MVRIQKLERLKKTCCLRPFILFIGFKMRKLKIPVHIGLHLEIRNNHARNHDNRSNRMRDRQSTINTDERLTLELKTIPHFAW